MKILLLSIVMQYVIQVIRGTTVTFSYSGSQATWIVPQGVVSINVALYGAQGGNNGWGCNAFGGKGGFVEGSISVTPQETLYLHVG